MRTSIKRPCRLIAAALAALQLCAGAAGAVFDNSFSYTYSLGSGLQYSRTEGKNSAGLQRANVLTYSPNTGVTPLMVYADEQLYGSKATITNAVKYLQNQGKTVLGGTNADFFVMSTGIPIGLVIDSGELISSDAWQYAVGFKKDGTAVLGRPTMGIRVSGKSGTVNVSYFNKTRTTAGAGAALPEARIPHGALLGLEEIGARRAESEIDGQPAAPEDPNIIEMKKYDE